MTAPGAMPPGEAPAPTGATDPASAAQVAASDPGTSVWLVANAGSGKTKVLTDRVARLLLRGVPPQNILCLTYTRAAAAEMQNRLFGRLGEWAMAPDAALRDHLASLGEGMPPRPAPSGAAHPGAFTRGETGRQPGSPDFDVPDSHLARARAADTDPDGSSDALARARRLFARALETPGGIRIQTIHSFCAGLLRRFPLEAGVSPAFTELDPRTAALLRTTVLDEICTGPDAPLFEAIATRAGEKVDTLLAEIISQRDAFATLPSEAAMRRGFGLPATLDAAGVLAATFRPGDAAVLAGAARALAAGSSTDQAAAAVLETHGPLDLAAIDRLAGIFLYKSGERAGAPRLDRFPTKATRAALGAGLAPLQTLMERIATARADLVALAAADEALTLHRFASVFVARYELAKALRGWFDFDDFIARASGLLSDPSVAPWVLYRLDGTIDHILVDEAQDTSPRQWRLIAALIEELTAGEGARAQDRSLFVVGDRKQSIYSFQGADVAAFEDWHGHFGRAFAEVGRPFAERRLEYSFRSSRVILDLVDRTFDRTMTPALGGEFRHRAFFTGLPGRVEVWPPVPSPEKPEEHEWFDPVDLRGENDAATVLGRQIAARLRELIDAGTMIPDRDGPRRLAAGDILVLVRRRGPVYRAIIRACKAAGLAMAGADRLRLADELAVRDILALLSFIDTPEDDLSLAVALRSPLLGWSEGRLYRLAHGRPGTLWEALLRAADGAEALTMLTDLRDHADFLRPHEMIERILTRHGGRRLLLGRLGPEASEAIDELLQQALAYEEAEVPSLGGFLTWIGASNIEVNRRVEGAGDAIRVMTVHGAKGLEAPVVILPDTAEQRTSDRAMTIALQGGLRGWARPAEGEPDATARARADRAAARAAEDLRLLYVAMTRASCWLIVAAAGNCSEGSWHGLISAGARAAGAQEDARGGLALSGGEWPVPAGSDTAVSEEATAGVDGAIAPLAPLPPPPARARVVSPSRLGGGAIPPAATATRGAKGREAEGETEDTEARDAAERGTLIHLLLRHLPENRRDDWPALAERLGADAAALAEATAILADPALAPLFGPGTLPEVEFSAPWLDGRIEGAIDRLVITPERIAVIDFKTNRTVPARAAETPEPYLRQLGAYVHAMEAIWPDRPVEAAILWTRSRRLMPLGAPLLRAALTRAREEATAPPPDAIGPVLDAPGGDP